MTSVRCAANHGAPTNWSGYLEHLEHEPRRSSDYGLLRRVSPGIVELSDYGFVYALAGLRHGAHPSTADLEAIEAEFHPIGVTKETR